MDSATPLLQPRTTALSAPISPVFLELATLEIRLGNAKACAPVARARQIAALYEERMMMDLKLMHWCCFFRRILRSQLSGFARDIRAVFSGVGVFRVPPHDSCSAPSQRRAAMSVSPPLETNGAYIFDASTFFKGLRSISLRNLSLRCAIIAPRKLRNAAVYSRPTLLLLLLLLPPLLEVG